jgi:hypothetical protein
MAVIYHIRRRGERERAARGRRAGPSQDAARGAHVFAPSPPA